MPQRPRGGVEVWLYSSVTSALEGVGGQHHAPAALPPGKDPVPIEQEAWWAPRPVWTWEKISPPPGFDPGPSSP
jgi:hypothetical protein